MAMSSLKRAFYDAARAMDALELFRTQEPVEIAPQDKKSADGDRAIRSGYAVLSGNVFDGSDTTHRVLTINSNRLQEGEAYHFSNGLLIVDGDIPARVTLNVDHGKLFVNGSIGEKSDVKVNVPQNFDIQHDVVYGPMGVPPIIVNTAIPKDFIYPQDKDPGIVVTGNVSKGAVVESNARAIVAGKSHISATFNLCSGENQFGFANSGIDALYVKPLVLKSLKTSF